jgi:hypothetical protein
MKVEIMAAGIAADNECSDGQQGCEGDEESTNFRSRPQARNSRLV